MADPICPADCTVSQITKIYITKPDATPFTDWTVPTEWETRIANTDPTEPTGDEIRILTVIGDKPAPSSNVIDISGGRKYTTNKNHTIPFDIDETNDVNYEAMRMLQCGGQFRIWYETLGGKLYGGDEGILATVDISDILARGVNEIEKLTGTLSWDKKFDPERTDSPIA